MTVIELPDQHAAALTAKAAEEGLTLEAWLKKLAGDKVPSSASQVRKEAAARIREIQARSKPDPEGWTIRDYIDYGHR